MPGDKIFRIIQTGQFDHHDHRRWRTRLIPGWSRDSYHAAMRFDEFEVPQPKRLERLCRTWRYLAHDKEKHFDLACSREQGVPSGKPRLLPPIDG